MRKHAGYVEQGVDIIATTNNRSTYHRTDTTTTQIADGMLFCI